MHIELWPIDRPKPYPRNARKWNAAAVAKVAPSIREYGFRQPIVVDVHHVIVIGTCGRRSATSPLSAAESNQLSPTDEHVRSRLHLLLIATVPLRPPSLPARESPALDPFCVRGKTPACLLTNDQTN